MMTVALQISGRAVQRHVQNVMCVLTRQSSSSTSSETKTQSQPKDINVQHDNNAHIRAVFHNRNPRNLELLSISSKPEGYHLDRFEVKYWHKLVVTTSQSKVVAEIVHNNGATVVSASSAEFAIRRFLYRPTDVSAHKAVGKVLARRCIESGINSVFSDVKAEEETKLDYLLKEAQDGGLVFEELPVYTPPLPHTKGVPTKPWDIIS